MSKVLTSRHLDIQTKLKILKCYVFLCSHLAQKHGLCPKYFRKNRGFWNVVFTGKQMISWIDRFTNDRVLTKLNTERHLLSDIQERKCTYYGHIKRKNNINLTTAVEGKIEGR